MSDVTARKRVEASLETTNYNPYHDRPPRLHSKGDVIPLDSPSIWLVVHGLAKLTTLSESGEEILVGLASENMVFSTSLTSLQTYQATALTEMQLVSLPLSELAESACLAQALLPCWLSLPVSRKRCYR